MPSVPEGYQTAVNNGRPKALDKGLPIEARDPFQDLIKRISG